MKKLYDLRSDTVTQPTPEMRKAMFDAEVGDDVLEEDPSVKKLEKKAAELLGKEAAMLVPSGTFGNQVSVLAHCSPGNEVILSEESHIVQHEAGAAAMVSGINFRTVTPKEGRLTWKEIEPRIRKEKDIHFPDTGLIEIENALSNGDVRPLNEMQQIYDGAKNCNIPVHVDGARIFNAAEALGCSASEIAQYADSVMFCLSKGLSAPVGSIVTGSKVFIDKARSMRKILGGGMRQAGIIAAPGSTALETMRKRLKDDHTHARMLAEAFTKEPDVFSVDVENTKINMVFVALKHSAPSGKDPLLSLLKHYGILIYPPEYGIYRFVTHYGIEKQDMEKICSLIPSIAEGIRTNYCENCGK